MDDAIRKKRGLVLFDDGASDTVVTASKSTPQLGDIVMAISDRKTFEAFFFFTGKGSLRSN